jgi:glycosyltransferase involved in cell wall biosynthesis
MKVCFLTGEYPPMQGGIADHTAHLAGHLVGLGVGVSILTSQKAAPALEPQAGEPDVYPLVTGWGMGCWRQIGAWLKQHAPDVLHIQYQAAAFDLGGWINWLPWWLGRRQARPRLVVTFHDLRVPYIFPKAGPLRWRSILGLACHSDAVVVTNVEDRQTLISHSVAAERLSLIPLGSNVRMGPPSGYDRGRWRASLGIHDASPLLAYFGFLNASKGGEDLILALERLVQAGYDAHLLMIGGQVGDVDATNRAYAERVRRLVEAHGLAGRVHWTGHTALEEVSANLLAADMLVMPYRDGVSFRRTTFIAALCHARPVVTTHPAVPLAELRHGENVFLVAPNDVEALAAAVIRLADEAGLRAHLSAGAERLARQFDWSTISRRTLELYQGLQSG